MTVSFNAAYFLKHIICMLGLWNKAELILNFQGPAAEYRIGNNQKVIRKYIHTFNV
jgi:hypothetical protein